MKQLLLFLLLLTTNLFSQDFETVDEKVLTYPRFSKVEDLAKRIDNEFSSDLEKVRAAFFWLAKNVRYNLKEYYNPRQRSYSFSYRNEQEKAQKYQLLVDQLVQQTFRNKMGVCEEYAQSFKKICDLLKIESVVIKGYVRNNARAIGNIPNSTNHAWNAVKVKDNWLILDATWAAGYEYNGKWIRDYNEYFFNIPKLKILKTHYPEDSLWMLRFGRISLEEFYNQPIYSNIFLNLDTELIAPLTGKIHINNKENFDLSFTNLDTTYTIFYVFRGQNVAKKPIVLVNKDITKLNIKSPNKTTDLILYINNKDALHFKVIVD